MRINFGKFSDQLFFPALFGFLFLILGFLIFGLPEIERRMDIWTSEKFQEKNPELYQQRLSSFLALEPGDLALYEGYEKKEVFTVLEVYDTGILICRLGLPGIKRRISLGNAYSHEYIAQKDKEAYKGAIVDDISYYYKYGYPKIQEIIQKNLQ